MYFAALTVKFISKSIFIFTCVLHWLDDIGATAPASATTCSASTVITHGPTVAKSVAPIHVVVTAIMVTIYKSIASSNIPSSWRVLREEYFTIHMKRINREEGEKNKIKKYYTIGVIQ